MITGSLVAIVTPMHEDGRLDLPRFKQLIDWHVAEGTDGIVVVGTTGESPTVDFDEHKELIRIAVQHSKRPHPDHRRHRRQLDRRGDRADRVGQEGGRHRLPVGGAVLQQADAGRPVPALPQDRGDGRPADDPVQRAGAARSPTCRTTPCCASRRCRASSASRTRPRTSSAAPTSSGARRAISPIYSGDDATALALILLGGHGVISVTANVAPQAMHEMCAAALVGDVKKAREINLRLLAAAPEPVRRGQPDPGQVGARRDGPDRARPAAAAVAAGREVPRDRARGAARGRHRAAGLRVVEGRG